MYDIYMYIYIYIYLQDIYRSYRLTINKNFFSFAWRDTPVCAHKNVRAHTHTHTRTHTYIYTHTHTHTHTRIRVPFTPSCPFAPSIDVQSHCPRANVHIQFREFRFESSVNSADLANAKKKKLKQK